MSSFRNAVIALLMGLAAGLVGTVQAADADPTMNQVYDAARAGHLVEAQQMMNQVLRDHPQSAKAHYVAAEVDARAGNIALARQELNTAQTLEPGLPFAPPGAVAALRSQLAQGPARYAVLPAAGARPAFPWLPVLLIGGGIAIAWMYLRRRAQQAMLPSPYPGSAGYPGGYPGGVPMGGPMGGGVGFPGVVGGGSGLVGGLASGLAVGAGMAAGEELVRHVFEGDRAMGQVVPEQREFIEPGPDQNANMGGNDFGVSDSSSWDDSSGSSWDDGGGSGGGGDWT